MISNGDGKSALILKNDRSSITPCTVLGDVIKAIHANCGKKSSGICHLFNLKTISPFVESKKKSVFKSYCWIHIENIGCSVVLSQVDGSKMQSQRIKSSTYLRIALKTCC